MRVLLDTNVLISAILFGGLPRGLLDRAIRGEFDVVSSPALLDELEEVMVGRFGLPHELGRAVRAELESLAEIVVPTEVPRVSRDPDDDQVLATAVRGAVDAVVTGDRDLLVLGSHREIEIIEPAELAARLDGG